MKLFSFLKNLTGFGSEPKEAPKPQKPISEAAWVDEAYVAQREELMSDPIRGPIAREAEAQATADDIAALRASVESFGIGLNPFTEDVHTHDVRPTYRKGRLDSGGNAFKGKPKSR